jgi:hypothetical protein
VLLAGTGLLYQTIASTQDASNYPPPGKLIDVGGYRFFQGNTGKQVPLSWLTLQKDLVSLSGNSTQMIATRSGHQIQLDQPDLVIAAIKQVLTGKV